MYKMKQNQVIVAQANLNDVVLAEFCHSPLLSDSVVETAMQFSPARRKQYLTCRFILADLLKRYFSIQSLPMIVADNGRPYFQSADLPDFNISHSQSFVVVAIATSGKVGIDIEQHRERKNYLNIAKQFFSEQEYTWLLEQSNSLNAFWQLWTLRESALKLYGRGVWQMKKMIIEPSTQQISASFGEKFYCDYQQLPQVHLAISCNQSISDLMLIPNWQPQFNLDNNAE